MIGKIPKKNTPDILARQDGFVLVTAIMLLFVAMVLGLMVVDSADMEIMLSGAQQRYEDSFNTTEGGAGAEAAAVGTSETITRISNSRSYSVVNPTLQNQVLSPANSGTDPLYDPGSDLDLTETVGVDIATDPEKWPVENLLRSDTAANNRFDYQYRVIYLHDDLPPKGFDAGKFSGYLFEIGAHRNTVVEMGGNKVGPKMSL
jgi:hypothetical protein